jgi:hypothetical protein|tara:strand:+ start:799 stop:1125 length:327 start_codon:yes stop_codon:yes gene_type:complete
MSENPVRDLKPIKFGEKEYSARLPVSAIKKIESELKTPLLKIAMKLQATELTLDECISILKIVIVAGGNDIEKDEIEKACNNIDYLQVYKLCADILTQGIGTDSEKKT